MIVQTKFKTFLFDSGKPHLDKEIDVDNDGVLKHLGQIADSMEEWEGKIAEGLSLTPTDVSSIHTRFPRDLKLQTYGKHKKINVTVQCYLHACTSPWLACVLYGWFNYNVTIPVCVLSALIGVTVNGGNGKWKRKS